MAADSNHLYLDEIISDPVKEAPARSAKGGLDLVPLRLLGTPTQVSGLLWTVSA